MEQRVVVGEIAGIHGVRGGVWVNPRTDSPDRGRTLREVFLLRGDEERRARVESLEIVGGRWLVRFAGVASRDQAMELQGLLVGVVPTDSPALPAGAFYVRDLIGREVAAEDGRILGTLTAVTPTGSNDVYTISGPDGDLLFPALKELVLECPPSGRTMKVRIPPGLLEACLSGRR